MSKAPPKFISLVKEKCVKEKVDFDKTFPKTQDYHKMNKDDYLFALQDVKAFREKFLLPHYKMRNLLELLNEKIKALNKQHLPENQLQAQKKELFKIRKQMANSRLEIYFCNVSNDEKIKPLANATMPYGLLHVGILLDDVCIQWGRSIFGKSIINPSKTVIYDDYIFAIELENNIIWQLIKQTFMNLDDYLLNKKDINTLGTIKALEIAEKQLNAIAEESVKYNTDKNYNLVFQNCQHFANNLIKKLGLRVNLKGEAGKVLDKAMDKLNRFDFSFKGKDFKTREDLDNYIRINDFRLFAAEERRVLFCFRNVFDYWARANPNDKKYKSNEFASEMWDDLAEKEKFGL